MTRDRQKGNSAWAEPHNGSVSEGREKTGPPSYEPVPEREARGTVQPAGREASSHPTVVQSCSRAKEPKGSGLFPLGIPHHSTDSSNAENRQIQGPLR